MPETKSIIIYKSVRGNRKTRRKTKNFSSFVCKTQMMLHKIYIKAGLTQCCTGATPEQRRTKKAAILYSHTECGQSSSILAFLASFPLLVQ